MKNHQKCVRLSDPVLKYIEGYRGENFSERLENYVLDTEERRERLVLDWEALQAQVNDKRRELAAVRAKLSRMQEADRRFQSLAAALLELLDA